MDQPSPSIPLQPTSPASPNEADVMVRVRYVECDPMNVVHHSVYPVWLEIARTELLRQRGLSYRELEASGVLIAVARLNIKYRRPAMYDDLLRIRVRMLPCAGVKIEHEYDIYRDDQLLAQAQTTLVCIDRQGRLQPVPSIILGKA